MEPPGCIFVGGVSDFRPQVRQLTMLTIGVSKMGDKGNYPPQNWGSGIVSTQGQPCSLGGRRLSCFQNVPGRL